MIIYRDKDKNQTFLRLFPKVYLLADRSKCMKYITATTDIANAVHILSLMPQHSGLVNLNCLFGNRFTKYELFGK